MNNKIVIEGISVKGLHGVLQIEKEKKQKFLVDVELNLNLENLQDNLKNTVDYAEVSKIVEKHITGESVSLIETLAEKIAQNIMNEFNQVNSVLVRIHKPKAPIQVKFKDVYVQFELKR
jgi:dihydroneopterin aldolase